MFGWCDVTFVGQCAHNRQQDGDDKSKSVEVYRSCLVLPCVVLCCVRGVVLCWLVLQDKRAVQRVMRQKRQERTRDKGIGEKKRKEKQSKEKQRDASRFFSKGCKI